MGEKLALRVAIVGRPNVGKSTLFNRLAGRRLALVHNTPGVTRDWRIADTSIAGWPFEVIDTAGLEDAFDASLEARMRKKTEEALTGADLILFVIDARAGITPTDEHFASWLRRTQKRPILLLANKAEGRSGEGGYYEAFSLGLGTPVAVSAEHGEGMGELYGELARFSEEKGIVALTQSNDSERDLDDDAAFNAREDQGAIRSEFDPSKPLQIVIVGRPNAGKSTLINALIGEERFLTGPEAGITRDSISVDFCFEDRTLRLFDTAGLRRQARIDDSLEKLSVHDSLRAIRFAQVVILLIDADSPLDKQDLTIARRVIEEGRALMIGINKWDAVKNQSKTMQRVRERLESSMPQVKGLPVITLSALYGRNLNMLMRAALQLSELWSLRFSTALLNKWLRTRIDSFPPPLVSGRRIKIRYMTQAKTRPPCFVLFGTRLDSLPESYKRYLENGLREDFNVWGTPLRFRLKKTENPYEKK